MRNKKIDLILNIILITISFFILIPIFWSFITSIKLAEQIIDYPPVFIPKPITFDNYRHAFASQPLLKGLLNSVILGIGASVIACVLSCLAAYSISRYKVKYKTAILIFIVFSMALPGIVNLIPLYSIYSDLGLIGNRLAVILLYIAGFGAFGMWVLKGLFDAVPIELEESAFLDGASVWQSFRYIALPLVTPGIIAIFIINFINVWNDFFTPAIFLLTEPDKQTITYIMYKFTNITGTTYGSLNAAAIVAIVLPVILFLLLRKRFMSVMLQGAIKG